MVSELTERPRSLTLGQLVFQGRMQCSTGLRNPLEEVGGGNIPLCPGGSRQGSTAMIPRGFKLASGSPMDFTNTGQNHDGDLDSWSGDLGTTSPHPCFEMRSHDMERNPPNVHIYELGEPSMQASG